MSWVADFYHHQYTWSSLHLSPVSEFHRGRVEKLSQWAGEGAKRMLELGAGAGQQAAAFAEAGHEVVAVELVEIAASAARRLGETLSTEAGSLDILEGDFLTLALDETFDVVCYWDGFGVGEDREQRQLLKRVYDWLAPDGVALFDIYNPSYWSAQTGKRLEYGEFAREYGFDAEECRMLDHWWQTHQPEQRFTQSLRCYSPADLRLLLEGTGLEMVALEPGGGVDNKGRYHERRELPQAMSYLAVLQKSTGENT